MQSSPGAPPIPPGASPMDLLALLGGSAAPPMAGGTLPMGGMLPPPMGMMPPPPPPMGGGMPPIDPLAIMAMLGGGGMPPPSPAMPPAPMGMMPPADPFAGMGGIPPQGPMGGMTPPPMQPEQPAPNQLGPGQALDLPPNEGAEKVLGERPSTGSIEEIQGLVKGFLLASKKVDPVVGDILAQAAKLGNNAIAQLSGVKSVATVLPSQNNGISPVDEGEEEEDYEEDPSFKSPVEDENEEEGPSEPDPIPNTPRDLRQKREKRKKTFAKFDNYEHKGRRVSLG